MAELESEDYLVYFILGSVIFMIILIQILNAIGRSSYKSNYCSSLEEQWSDFGKVSSVDPNNAEYKDFFLRDYYIKTAYNCCALGEFKNTYVSTCQLKNVIKQGVRCLDFEIYSVNNEPVVAVSSVSSFNVKETYNSLKFDKILKIIRDYAFSGGNCPNPRDPLIIHLRIKSNNGGICKTMAENIKDIFQPTGRLLGRDYSYENYGTNLGKTLFKDIFGKIVIIVDKTNTSFENTDLEEYVNLASNSVFMRALRNYDVEFTPNPKELTNFNKKHMTFTMPDLSSDDKQPNVQIHSQYGCQMIGMCYQNVDENLKYYENIFANKGSAFVLKPSSLRYKPVMIDAPRKQTENVSYGPREKSTDFYKFTL